jgi:hypothetical protein
MPAIMIIGLANGRRVDLSHIASQFPGAAFLSTCAA